MESLRPPMPQYGVDVSRAPAGVVQRRKGPLIHIVLFAATFVTTATASAFSQGFDLFAAPSRLVEGFPFAVTVMTILLFHEFGHYFLARLHGVDATLPYFIPAPPIFFFGTLGAFIRMRGRPSSRRALFDIGAAGPWAGFVVAVPAVIIGLLLSDVQPLQPNEGGLIFGDSILFGMLVRIVLGVDPAEATILLHPVAQAGWFGLLVTCLNLLPVGQLDGGHVAYAVFGRHHTWISRGVLAALIVMGLGGWPGWLLWAVLLLALGLHHPPTWDAETPLDRRRVVAAGLTLLIFILTFMPEPLSISEPLQVPIYEEDSIPISAPVPAPRGFVIPL